LIQDIARYEAHPDCQRLICFVYDPEGRLANPRGLEKDLSREGDDRLSVSVIVVAAIPPPLKASGGAK
jgi:hypothetical protein